MAIDRSGKLEKLRVQVYEEPEPVGTPKDTFEVMFNPASLTVRHRNIFRGCAGQGSSGQRANYSYSKSRELSFELILDGTGVTDVGLANILGKTKSVAKRVENFLDLCFHRDGNIHEPKYLRLNWGVGPLENVDARLVSVDIEYTSFDRNGSPLRAVLKTKFKEDVAVRKRNARDRSASPDLTHTRVVRSGDTLPLLSKAIYGTAKYYLQLAQVNHLDNFRELTPGTELFFPPLSKSGENSAEP